MPINKKNLILPIDNETDKEQTPYMRNNNSLKLSQTTVVSMRLNAHGVVAEKRFAAEGASRGDKFSSRFHDGAALAYRLANKNLLFAHRLSKQH